MGVPYRCPRTGGLGQGQHLFLRRFLRSKKRNSAAEKRGRGGKEKGFGEKEFPPRPSEIFLKSRCRDFPEKRFEFHPKETAL